MVSSSWVPAAARRWLERLGTSWLGRVLERSLQQLVRAELFDRSMTLAAQAFTSVFPLLILAATLRPRSRSTSGQLGQGLAESLGLDAQARNALEAALPSAASAANAFGVLGALVVLLSATSFSRALVRMYAKVWDVRPPTRLRAFWRLQVVLLGVVLLVVVLTSIRRALVGSPLSAPAEGLAALVLGLLLWTWVPWLLLARRVPARMLVPGGLLMALALVLLSLVGRVYLPRALSSATEQYGALGISFTYVTWLFVIMVALVGSTVVGAVVATDDGPAGRLVRGPGDRVAQPS
jgi:membrane protein